MKMVLRSRLGRVSMTTSVLRGLTLHRDTCITTSPGPATVTMVTTTRTQEQVRLERISVSVQQRNGSGTESIMERIAFQLY